MLCILENTRCMLGRKGEIEQVVQSTGSWERNGKKRGGKRWEHEQERGDALPKSASTQSGADKAESLMERKEMWRLALPNGRSVLSFLAPQLHPALLFSSLSVVIATATSNLHYFVCLPSLIRCKCCHRPMCLPQHATKPLTNAVSSAFTVPFDSVRNVRLLEFYCGGLTQVLRPLIDALAGNVRSITPPSISNQGTLASIVGDDRCQLVKGIDPALF